MDRERFDALAKLLATTGSRRAALGAVLGIGLLGHDPDSLAKPGKGKGQGKGKHRDNAKNRRHDKKDRRRRDRVRTEAAPGCCSSGACAPGPGKNLTRCCYEGANLARADFKGVNATGASFRGANLTGADFGGANLSGACFVLADITSAKFGGANQRGVIRCRTKTDAGIDDSGCVLVTACCREPDGAQTPGPLPPCNTAADCPDRACQTKACTNRACVYTAVGNAPSPNGLCATHCCRGACCAPRATTCNPANQCCVPVCAGKVCGPDGCGGECDNLCPPNTVCNGNGTACLCTAQSCPDGCCSNGPGKAGVCQPNSPQACGTGGTACRPCPTGQACVNGACICNDGVCYCNLDSCPDGCCTNGYDNPGTCVRCP